MRLQHEAFSELLAEVPATKLPEIALQIAASEICRRLQELTQQAQALTAETDPIHFTRLVNSLARISREVLQFQKYHDAQAQATQQKMLDPKRELTEEERTAILDKIDDIFGCKAYRKRYGELPILGPAVLPPNDPLPGRPTSPIAHCPSPILESLPPTPTPAPSPSSASNATSSSLAPHDAAVCSLAPSHGAGVRGTPPSQQASRPNGESGQGSKTACNDQ